MKKVTFTGNQFENVVDLVAVSLLSDQLSELDLDAFPSLAKMRDVFCDYTHTNIEDLMKSQATKIEEV